MKSRSFARALVTSIELTTGSESGPSSNAPIPRPRRIHMIVRLHGHPVGMVDAPLTGDTNLVEIARSYAWNNFQEAISTHLSNDGIAMPENEADFANLSTTCNRPLDVAPSNAPMITVTIATIGNVQASLRTTRRLLESRYPRFEVVIVDNTPGPSDFESAMRASITDHRVSNRP